MLGLKRRAAGKASFARKGRQIGPARGAAWPQALIFNALLLIAPILAGRIVINAFAEQGFGDAPTALAISQTREAIDRSFRDLVAVSGDPDAVWAQKVDEQVRLNNMEAARGFLIAGPQMMSPEMALSLEAAAREEPSGSEDERLARAATIFLPDAVRARYERQLGPNLSSIRAAEEPAETEGDDTAEPTSAPSDENAAAPEEAAPDADDPARAAPAPVRSATFDLVGDSVDLANRSARWIREEPTDTVVLRLRGFAQVAEEAIARSEGIEAPFNVEDLALGVSVVSAGQRAGRLHPDFARTIRARVETALPEEELRTNVEGALAQVATTPVRAQRVREAFLSTARPAGIRRLALELELVSRIAQRTSATAALDLIQYARSRDDLRRLRLITEAGGDRAAALAVMKREEVLSLATSGIKWTRDLYLQVMGLAAIGMALMWSMLSALRISIFDEGPHHRPVSV